MNIKRIQFLRNRFVNLSWRNQISVAAFFFVAIASIFYWFDDENEFDDFFRTLDHPAAFYLWNWPQEFRENMIEADRDLNLLSPDIPRSSNDIDLYFFLLDDWADIPSIPFKNEVLKEIATIAASSDPAMQWKLMQLFLVGKDGEKPARFFFYVRKNNAFSKTDEHLLCFAKFVYFLAVLAGNETPSNFKSEVC